MKFQENLSRKRHAPPCRQTDR